MSAHPAQRRIAMRPCIVLYRKVAREEESSPIMNKKIILASESPRRAELLKKIIKNFSVFPSDVDESKIREKDPVKLAVFAAVMKAEFVAKKFPRALVIAADTIVVYKNKIFGKPKNRRDAQKTLRFLSGKTHEVITGLAVYSVVSCRDLSLPVTGYEITKVKFKKITDKEIEYYLDNYEVLDKAGSYAIQDINDMFIKSIKGNYDNVVGLPVKKLKKLIRDRH